MAGESSVLEMAFQNVAQDAFAPNTFAELDADNSGPVITAAKTAAGGQVIGVIYDRARLDMNGDVVSAGMNVRMLGIARLVASGAIAVGDGVGAGDGGKAVSGGSAGIAITQAQEDGDEVLVLLTPSVAAAAPAPES